jgi:hypothetical protein
VAVFVCPPLDAVDIKASVTGGETTIRYKVTGVFDIENKVMYYDMTTAEATEYRAPKN